jgi:hypothetical protein
VSVNDYEYSGIASSDIVLVVYGTARDFERWFVYSVVPQVV